MRPDSFTFTEWLIIVVLSTIFHSLLAMRAAAAQTNGEYDIHFRVYECVIVDVHTLRVEINE